MTSDRRRGLGRGLGALIPTAPDRPTLAPDPAEEPPAPAPAAAAPAPSTPPPPSGPGVTSTSTGRLGDAVSQWVVGSAAPDGLAPVDGAYFAELPIDAIAPNPRQPRTVFDEEAMAELAHSIGEIGLLQPVVVRDVGDGRDELVMGERRWRASRAAGLDTIPSIVRDTADDALLRDALLENLHRSQLNPLEEAAAYDQLLQDFGCTHDELGVAHRTVAPADLRTRCGC